MNKKVGIVTFHNAHNYGAVIQALALRKKIESYGFEVDFIQSPDSYIQNKYRKFPIKRESNESIVRFIKKTVHYFLDLKRNLTRYNNFQDFISNEIPVTLLNSEKKHYDYVVLGSDQIWNSNITKGLDEIFFGRHTLLDAKKVIAYAASMGNATSKENIDDKFLNLVQNVDRLGVREDSLKTLMSENISESVELNLDPTLLLDEHIWKSISPRKNNSERYILVYQVYNSKITDKVVDYLKEEYGYKVKVLSSAPPTVKMNENVLATASPYEYLELFANASFVVTTSFHGTVFSIINEVPFFTIKINEGVDKRSASLLANLNLTERHILNIADLEKIDNEMDFTMSKVFLEKMRLSSDKYLRDALDVG
ncbi:polysaccharide pyruvyl transferase family protein [Vibrio vulnificus]|uniref:polysaccharide pyruvyl transferase family protein n=1 Tax=Vibrio vulnificus TaxID=672 RepID=UPI001A2CF93B|nr:polysaccharide pyruvyl transferase family protein [Vibrio vulnificus]MDK2668850.1 polysaccharide pyruvyl transferase family protein [Vibrio vulnificus]HAS8338590.1 polysaccharide pyruvyl transferase family protein [Vibrio vulnificus]